MESGNKQKGRPTHFPTQYPTKMLPLEIAFLVEPATLAVEIARRRT